MAERARTAKLFERIRYGGDYNPEQWSRPVWEEDVALMAEAGVNLVTVGVFSWATLEPAEGRFDFGWLVEVLDLLAGAGIGVDLATPTAAPPPWVATRYPGTLPVDERGSRYAHGSRQHLCICSPDYLRLALAVVERLAGEVGGHPALEMWHVHNEYACHVPYCYCDHHEAAFRAWLGRRYGTPAALNDAWGTAFWSQRYGDFAEVIPPRRSAAAVNPATELDYRRFSSDAFLEELRAERAVLRSARPDLPVTTNFMGMFKPLDYFAWAPELDVVSTDNYQDPADPEHPAASALHYDLVRSLDKSAPWMVMEQTSSRVNWRPRNVPKAPGAMRALSFQAVARGARGVLFFQWRASRSGAEKFHSAMLGHAGTATPAWEEVAALGRELAALGAVGEAAVEAPVALCVSWASWWALEAPGQPANDLLLGDQLRWLYTPLYRAGVTVDFCQPGEALSGYAAVMLPSLYLLGEAEGANVARYVEGGGTAVVSFWSGIVDERDAVHLGPYGGPLRGLFGAAVIDVAPLPPGASVAVEWADGARTTGTFWTDVIEEGDGEVLARLASGPHAGRPVVVAARRGAGRCLYVGTRLDGAGLERVFALLPVVEASRPGEGVERVVRRGSDASYEFLLNHAEGERRVEVAPGTDLLSGQPVGGTLSLASQGVAVVRRPAP